MALIKIGLRPYMTKHSEILTVEDKPRETSRIPPRLAQQLSRFFPQAEINREEEASEPRFQIDSIEPAPPEPDRPNSRMRVLLRNAKTMKYFRSGERWTKNPKQARDFRNGWWATVHA